LAKNNSNHFCPTTKVVSLGSSSSSSIRNKQQVQTPVVFTQNTPDSGREKKNNRRTEKQAMGRGFSRPCLAGWSPDWRKGYGKFSESAKLSDSLFTGPIA
jgi:hypothetical protein